MRKTADEDPDLVIGEDKRLKKKRKKIQTRETEEMKKTADEEPDLVIEEDKRLKKKRKKKLEEEDDEHEIGLGNLTDDLTFEVLKHLDVKTLATAACVNKKWSKMAEDDRLWEFIYTRRWVNMDISNRQFRSYVLRLGGFRSFFSGLISTLSEKQTSSSSSIASSSSRTTIVKPVPNSGNN
ncbi:hypothetical protein MKW92_035256 [Papaver armeniacum]|nr:hypothetical protein MKW92_035256 [Papaver armeniacum]